MILLDEIRASQLLRLAYDRFDLDLSESVGDLFMSLIHTCQLCGANCFDYQVELQRHAQELADRPTEWMPWNCRETLERIVNLPDLA